MLGVTQSEQLLIDRDTGRAVEDGRAQAGERAARSSLRDQVARLERELSAIVADGFPYIPAPGPMASKTVQRWLAGLY